MNLEWFKKHPYAAGAAILVSLVVIYLLFRGRGSSGGGLASLAAGQQQGQLQLASENAQLSAQQDQTQAQLASQEYAGSLQASEQQNQLVAGLASSIIPMQLEANVYEQQIAAATARQQSLLPLEQTAISQVGRGGSLEYTGTNELALLLGQAQGFPAPLPPGRPGIGSQIVSGLFSAVPALVGA